MELGEKEGLVRELEGRVVPALVVRCAQHLLVWGVQEEGLFRVSGRPSHVSKLRSEFDSGADYDMTGCTPGDLDPHAVASVFKAYLRELPESILTQKLAHYFDAAISKETTLNAPPQGATPNPHRMSIAPPGMGLPSGPKSNFPPTPTTPSHQNPTPNMRKAPSLSTLAMPSFTGIPPPSAPLLATITALIAQLPKENRDLLRTVVQLINATAKESRETKMPLSNLMVVFSPSLNMSPPLLKVLCEGEGIWGGEGEVIDIRRESVLDIKRMDGVEGGVDVPPPTPTKDAEEETEEDEEEEDEESDEEEDEEEEDQSLLSSGRASLDTSDNPSSDYHASAEEDSSMSMSMSLFDREGLDQRRGDGVRRRWVQEDRERPEVPTVYLDSQSHISSSSTSSLREQDLEPEREQAPAKLNYLHHHRRRDDGSISSGGEYSLNNPPPSSPSPCLSSSAESVATPTSDGNPSFAHLPLVGGDGDGKKETEKEHACQKPQIAETSPLELKKRPVVIGNPMPVVGPVQFPVAQQQQAQAQASKRRSIPILALPTFSSNATDVVPKEKEDSPVASPRSISGGGGLNFRSKKPSLRLLFSKKSASSLNSIGGSAVEKGGKPFISPPMAQYSPSGGGVYLQTPGSASDSSVSTPLSAVTAPQGTSTNASSRSHLPPVLDTPIDDGSLGLGLGLAFDASPPGTAVPVMEEKPTPTPKMSISTTDTIASWYQTMTPSSPTSRSFSSPSSCSYPSPSPVSSSAGVASASVTASQSLRSPIKPGENHLRPQMSTSNLSIASTKSENHLSMFDDGDDEEVEDWTQSVLLAADVDGKWAVQSGGRS